MYILMLLYPYKWILDSASWELDVNTSRLPCHLQIYLSTFRLLKLDIILNLSVVFERAIYEMFCLSVPTFHKNWH